MKTVFVSHRNRRSGSRRLLVATAAVVCLFALDVASGGMLRHEVQSAGATVRGAMTGIGNSVGRSGVLVSYASLEAQNKQLEQELAQYKNAAAFSQLLVQENVSLGAIAHLPTAPSGVTAPIDSSVISSPYGTFLIGAGSQEGIASGSLVLSTGGFVLGRVTDVAAHIATVSEIFAPTAITNAAIRGTAVQLDGEGGDALAKLPRGATVALGDPVVVPAFGQRPVGIVGNIASSSANAWQSVYVGLPVSLSSMQYVYVIPFGN